MIIVYGLFLAALTVYSFALVDPNITFLQHRWWVGFREIMVQLGYYQRSTSWYLYLILVIGLFMFHFFFIKNVRRFHPIKIAFVVGSILLLSYPFLSHDFFNYLFDAKILTFYRENPYLHKALDFPADPWLRFMQWTHRTYPYGPIFLLISAVPSFLSFGKFLVDFILFKATFIFFYILAVWVLQKKDKASAMTFATHPLVLIEGLVAAHNDIIAVGLAIIGMWYLSQKRAGWGRVMMLFSAGIKYLTVPLVFFSVKSKLLRVLVTVATVGLLVYLSLTSEVQPWYFLNLFFLLLVNPAVISRLALFFAGLLLSYYPYIALGDWGDPTHVQEKHLIIISFLILNAVFLLPMIIQLLSKRKFLRI